MNPKTSTIIVFGAALLLNWTLVSEDYSSGQLLKHWSISANTLLLIVAIIFSILGLRRIVRRIESLLLAKGVIKNEEKIVNWRNALIAPLPVLISVTYAWLPTSTPLSKVTLQYGGSGISGLLYIALAAFLVFTQIEHKLKENGA
jgi:hypothetical protein